MDPIYLNDNTLHFLAIGDYGRGDDGQKAVADQMALYSQIDPVDLVILAGDNFYPSGVDSVEDPRFDTYFRNIYSKEILNVPFYAVMGNHDHLGNPRAQIEYVDPDERWTFPSLFYKVRYELNDQTSVDFFMLDTYTLVENYAVSPYQVDWLTRELQASDAEIKVAIGHHPLFSSGYHGDSPLLQDLLLELFLQNHVSLYISGHDHHLEIFTEDQGFRQIISGGASDNLRPVEGNPDSEWSQSILGFIALEFQADSYHIEAVDSEGNLLYSSITTLTSRN